MSADDPPEELADELVSAARTTIGDRLRSVTYFDQDGRAQVYLRDDLAADADLTGFVETERMGFRSKSAYGESEMGDYRFTIRAFEHGYLTRVIAEDRGVFVTTEALSMDRFSDLASALEGVLADG